MIKFYIFCKIHWPVPVYQNLIFQLQVWNQHICILFLSIKLMFYYNYANFRYCSKTSWQIKNFIKPTSIQCNKGYKNSKKKINKPISSKLSNQLKTGKILKAFYITKTFFTSQKSCGQKLSANIIIIY